MRHRILNCKLLAVKPRPVVAVPAYMKSAVALTAIVLMFFAAGCWQKAQNAQSSVTDKSPARSVVERGPVKVTAEVQPPKARLSDEPMLTLTIEYEDGVQVEKPPFSNSMGSFLIRDFHEPLPKNPRR